MLVKMIHPEHGMTFPSSGEVESCLKNGWKFVVDEPPPPKVEIEVVKPTETTLHLPRRGRPPKVK